MKHMRLWLVLGIFSGIIASTDNSNNLKDSTSFHQDAVAALPVKSLFLSQDELGKSYCHSLIISFFKANENYSQKISKQLVDQLHKHAQVCNTAKVFHGIDIDELVQQHNEIYEYAMKLKELSKNKP